MRRILMLFAIVGVAGLVLVGTGPVAAADSTPTGQRTFHGNTLEPVYNAANAGQIGYLMEPHNRLSHANPHAWAPIYLPVYPIGSTAAATFSCMHVPVENCPTHGDAIAGLAQSMEPSVYGGGVLGHDHVFDFPGADDFNIAWEPTVVLFTNSDAANEHLLTDDAIQAAVDRGDAIEIPLPSATFKCAVVSAAIWNMATPLVG